MPPLIGQPMSADEAMKLAIKTAKRGLGFVSPNPPVGCVIVDKDHCFVSRGVHLKWGGNHAEINAVNQVQDPFQLEEASVYVTLEPCAHRAKTGSCARSLAELPIKRVYYGLMDPNPKVSGKGLEILKAHNKEVIQFEKYQSQCEKLCEQFLFRIKHEKPFVALKVGVSLDGKVALKSGESQWITGQKSREYGRELRAHYDATFVGAGTVLYDDPRLDFRGTRFEGKKNNRLVLFDPGGKVYDIFPGTKISKTHFPENIFVISPSEQILDWSKRGIQAISWDQGPKTHWVDKEQESQSISSTQDRESWKKVFHELYAKGLFSLFVEGGPRVFGQILQWGLAQKIYLFESPKIVGSGLSWSQFFENKKLSQAPWLQSWETHFFNEDRLRILYFCDS